MTFHQYKMVKRLTRLAALLSISALFMNTLTLFALRSIKAEDSCAGTVSIHALNSAIEEIQPNEDFPFTIRDDRSITSSTVWNYYVYVKDMTTSKEGVRSQGTFTGSKDLSVNFNTIGAKEIWVVYRKSGEGCENQTTDKLSANVVLQNTATPTIELEADSLKVTKGTAITIKMTINNLEGGDATLTIDDTLKWKGDITSNTFNLPYTWDTTYSSLGMHTVKLKAFGTVQSDGTRAMTDMKTVNINLCAVGSDLDKCASGGTGDSGVDGDGTSVSVPEETDVEFGGSILKFNLTRGSGIGGLVRFIILLLLTLIGAFAFISLMIAGVQYIMAGGDSSKTDKAKKTMIQAAIAILLATFSFEIFSLVNSLF